MKLQELSAKPKLIQITIDDKDIVAKYDEPVEFWMYDRHSMDTFMAMANVKENNLGSIANLVRDIVLDENGNKILADGETLPSDILMKVITKVVDSLGNSNSQTTKK